ncbi:MAG: trypsin-like peptidase domain-containing protein, partial [Cyanobacteriota bacterium]|nr:trypsin-like peptidase domain-containing protein [Cyanobacteriota bacterium]
MVGESRSVKLTWADGQEENAAVVADAGAATPQTDLAIKRQPPNVGADVVALGAPKGLEFSLTRGVVSSLRDNGEILQLDAPINPGNSGGPVLDQTGCVVGIATFKISESEGLNFAVAAGVMANFLAKPPPVAQELPPA